MTQTGFAGRSVVVFEVRRESEMASLVARHGGVTVSAPAVREVPDDIVAHACRFFAQLSAGELDDVVFMTGVGARRLFDAIVASASREGLVSAFARVRIVARGGKPASALRDVGLTQFAVAAEPSTWREALEVLRAAGPLAGRRIAVQEHGAPSTELYDALAQAGASVFPVRVYRWELPEDIGPLRSALAAIASGAIRVALFTSAIQVDHVFRVARAEGIEGRVREALAHGIVASIGPSCSEALRAAALEPDVEPEHPKMGHLVKEAAAAADRILQGKAAVG